MTRRLICRFIGGMMAGWLGGLQRSLSVLVRLEELAVQLLLGFVELPQLLGLTFAQLFALGVVGGETLEAQSWSPLTGFTHIS